MQNANTLGDDVNMSILKTTTATTMTKAKKVPIVANFFHTKCKCFSRQRKDDDFEIDNDDEEKKGTHRRKIFPRLLRRAFDDDSDNN